MDQIARAAGVVRRTVYGHFPSREALIGALIDGAVEDVAAAHASGRARSEDPAESLAHSMVAVWEIADGYRLLVALAQRSVAMEGIRQRLAPVREECVNVLRQGLDDGSFTSSLPPAALAYVHEQQLFGLMEAVNDGLLDTGDAGRAAASTGPALGGRAGGTSTGHHHGAAVDRTAEPLEAPAKHLGQRHGEAWRSTSGSGTAKPGRAPRAAARRNTAKHLGQRPGGTRRSPADSRTAEHGEARRTAARRNTAKPGGQPYGGASRACGCEHRPRRTALRLLRRGRRPAVVRLSGGYTLAVSLPSARGSGAAAASVGPAGSGPSPSSSSVRSSKGGYQAREDRRDPLLVDLLGPGADQQRGHRVAREVGEGAGLAHEAVDADDQADTVDERGLVRLQAAREDRDARSRDARRALGRDHHEEQQRDLLTDAERLVHGVGDEERGHGQVDHGAVEVEGVAGRHGDADDRTADPEVLHLRDEPRQRGLRRGGGGSAGTRGPGT
ncbi:hypothetical protein SALBM135S_10114 [Streptomyces alboniger]